MGAKIDGKYRGMVESEREEERRKMDAYEESHQRGPGRAVPWQDLRCSDADFKI